MRGGTGTKERIERAAIHLFVRNGISGTSIRDIAVEAGVSQGAMYNHYRSKEELAWQLFSQGWSRFARDLREIARAAPTFDARIRAMTHYVFQRFDDDQDLVSFIWFTRHEQLKRVRGNLPNPHLVYRLVIIDGMRAGDIPRRDPEIMTTIVMGALIQSIDTKVLGRIRSKLSEAADEVAEACLRMLGE